MKRMNDINRGGAYVAGELKAALIVIVAGVLFANLLGLPGERGRTSAPAAPAAPLRQASADSAPSAPDYFPAQFKLDAAQAEPPVDTF